MSENGSPRPPQPLHRPLGPTFYRYVALEALRPTIYALLGLTIVVLTKDLLGFSDLVINRGLSVGTVALIALYTAVPIAALVFPFSVLLGCLVAMGRLGADREILTLEASGVAATRLVWPVVVFATFMTVGSVWLSTLAAPWAARSLDASLAQVSRAKPAAQIKQGRVNKFGDWQLEAREVSSGGDRLKGVLMWMPDVGETIFARSARVDADETGALRIHLQRGSVVLSPRNGANELRFETLTTMLPDTDKSSAKRKETRIQAMSFAELEQDAQEYIPTKRHPMPQAAIEYQRRIAMPAAALVFGFLAAPLFLIRGNYSRSSGGVIGLLLTVSYYGLVQLGEGLIQSGRVIPLTGVWLANGILAGLAVIFLLLAVRGKVLGAAFERRRSAPPTQNEVTSRYQSRRYPLPRYIAGRFIQLGLLTFAVLLVAYLLIDVMERLDWFARYRASASEIVRFYGARIPLLASRVVPMALLVATALTVSLLAAEGELIGMRACGIPAPRALLPVLILSLLAVPAYFALNDFVVPRTNALADELKQSEIKGAYYEKRDAARKEAVWYRSGDKVLEAELFDPDRGMARKLVIYSIGEDGLPVSRLDSASAHHIGRGDWRLIEPSFISLENGMVRELTAPRYAALGEALPAKVDTMHLSIAALESEIEQVEADGYDATAFRVDRQMKLAQPLACVILPALVLFFAVGGPPFPGPAQNLLISGIVGVGYILLTGVSASFGYGGTLHPVMAGWGPNLLFASVTGFFAWRLWRSM